MSLPILADHNPSGQIRKSKNGKRRAVVLVSVQLLLIAHIGLWLLSKKYGWFGGQTITPVEPSESMDFVKSGLVNAGLIFFSLALLGTLIFGRWFCGWGCHIVMLQDFCGWIMKKCGVRPKPFRSRFLIYVPLILALYMFIWPAAYRWGLLPLDAWMADKWGAGHWAVAGLRGAFNVFDVPLGRRPPAWEMSVQLTTSDFWRTFAKVAVAIPFLFVCGIAVVYFLGAKGFCTYGCPYGGFFAPLDKFATGRILVTDACEGCGHCTAVCTSNVRVHEEVREYGMVVDPGCMKCMDCVSVCPNDALYFGFARPAIVKGPAKNQAPKRIFDLTLGEEFAAALVFLLTFLCVRGVYGAVPMLMAAGLAGITTFLVWKAWRVVRDPNVTLHRFQLKLKGLIRPAGYVFLASVGLLLALVAHSGAVNAMVTLAGRQEMQVTINPEAIFSANPQPLSPEMAAHADRAIALYRRASSIREGGIALLGAWQPDIDMKVARLLSAKLDFVSAEHTLRRAIERDGPSDLFCSSLAWMLAGQRRSTEAMLYAKSIATDHAHFNDTADAYVQLMARAQDMASAEEMLRLVIDRDGPNDRFCSNLMLVMQEQSRAGDALQYGKKLLLEQRDFLLTLNLFVNMAGATGDTQMIIELCRARLAKFPDHLYTMRWLAVVLRQSDALDESLALTKRTIELDPDNSAGRQYLIATLMDFGRIDEAIEAGSAALKRLPDDIALNSMMADMLENSNRAAEAAPYRKKAEKLQAAAALH